MQNNIFTVIALGDVVGKAATDFVCENLNHIKHTYNGDFILVNAENAYEGNGTDTRSALKLLESGADVLTGGNHTIRIHDFFDTLDENDAILRPANLPPLCPGKGFSLSTVKSGLRILVINVIGQIFTIPCDNPFLATEKILKEYENRYDLAICDFHGEATSEKNAFAEYFDGRILIMYGTHTHVATADERLLKKGSAFITDIGMCGSDNSVLGITSEIIIKQFVTGIHNRYEKATEELSVNGAVFEVDLSLNCIKNIKRIKYKQR